MDTITAIAIILGRKICFAPPERIIGFFSTSLIEESFERLSYSILVLLSSAAAPVVEAAIFTCQSSAKVTTNPRGDSTSYKPPKPPNTPPHPSPCRHPSAASPRAHGARPRCAGPATSSSRPLTLVSPARALSRQKSACACQAPPKRALPVGARRDGARLRLCSAGTTDVTAGIRRRGGVLGGVVWTSFGKDF